MRRIFAAVSLLLLAACSASAPRTAVPKAAKRPNIVFVLTDDMSYNLMAYMPQVQLMRRQGTEFGNYFVTDSLCCPSRATTFTGQYPHDTGVYTNTLPDGGFRVFNRRGKEQETFATALQSAGYRTALFGKYMNGYWPTKIKNLPPKYVPPGWTDWAVGGNAYKNFDYDLNENGRIVKYGHRPQDYLTDVLAAKSEAFIRQSAKAKQPFMMEVASYAPHEPYTPAPRHANLFPGLTAPRGPSFNEADISDKPKWLHGQPTLTAHQITKIDADFRKRAQAVQAVDEMIARLRATLKQAGVADNTYLVFSSDNGLHMGEARLMPGKTTAYDIDIKTPLVVTGPGVRKGFNNPHIAQNTDLCPTFEDLAGLPPQSTVDGHSLAPMLRGAQPKTWRQAALVEHHQPSRFAKNQFDPDRPHHGTGNAPNYEAIRTATELYVEYADGQREYYDLTRDPYEIDNAYSRLSPARLAQLKTALNAVKTCKGPACP